MSLSFFFVSLQRPPRHSVCGWCLEIGIYHLFYSRTTLKQNCEPFPNSSLNVTVTLVLGLLSYLPATVVCISWFRVNLLKGNPQFSEGNILWQPWSPFPSKSHLFFKIFHSNSVFSVTVNKTNIYINTKPPWSCTLTWTFVFEFTSVE